MRAVRHDISFAIGDSDLDRFIREEGGVFVDGETVLTAVALKRRSPGMYRELRENITDGIASEVKDAVESGMFPIEVPFVYLPIEVRE